MGGRGHKASNNVTSFRGNDQAIPPINAHGGVRRGDFSVLQCNTEKQGNTQAYLVRRLKRDAPAIAADLAAGKYRSARAAAKAAGIIHDPTPLETLHRIWRKVSPEDRAKFLIEMLTPAERRLIQTGLWPDEEPTP
jgi:hypothetical protein